MSRGNPYGGDSFPLHERRPRGLLVVPQGGQAPQSLGWVGGKEGAAAVFKDAAARDKALAGCQRLPWAVLLVSEQTRQFYAYKDIAERFLPGPFGAFRAACE